MVRGGPRSEKFRLRFRALRSGGPKATEPVKLYTDRRFGDWGLGFRRFRV